MGRESNESIPQTPMTTTTIEISQELKQRIEGHLEEEETVEEFLEELVSIYETQGTFMQEGYSE